MAVEFKLPKIAEGVESGDVLEILVSVGDTLELEQEVMELETDKATVFVPSDVEGVVTGINCDIGDTIAVGQVILSVEPAAAAAAPAPLEAAPVETPPVAEKPIEAVQEPVAPVPPVQPVAPVPPVAPVVSKPAPAPIEKNSGKKAVVAAGPAIRRFAREVGVDLQMIQGSGEHGRIVREDVLKVVREGSRQSGGSSSAASGRQSDGYGPVHVEKMPKIRQTIAKKMHESWTTCPRVTNFDDADVTALEEIRQNSKKEYAAGGIKLTSMPFLVKAVAMALKSHPVINASVDLEQGQIIYKDYVNVGIAIDTERGLVVPSLREADKLGIPDVARQLGQMAENVRSGDFSIDDLRGGTFTISNLGAIGGTYSTPIINTPETAILLVGRSRKLPVVVGDEVKIRLMMPLSLSYDHRLIDGGAAARFLNEVIGYLEAPSRLLLAL
jgi:pyruvate/2-oxoglutarate dehydrogenase complex dihydrolipoamide acyltransferase (E2) component